MQTTKRYSFTLGTSLQGSVPISAHPAYKELALSYEREDNSFFFTRSCSSNFSFLDTDFDYILSYPLNTKFILTCYEGDNVVLSGYFKRSSGSVDVNHKCFETSIKVDDPYTLLLDHADDEYNLLDLSVSKQTLQYYVYPSVQIVARGDSYSHNFTLQTYSAAEVEEVSYTPDLFSEMHFRYNFLLTAVCWEDGDKLYSQTIHQDGSSIYNDAANYDGSKALILTYFTSGSDTYYYFSLNINSELIGSTETNLLWVLDSEGKYQPNWSQTTTISFTLEDHSTLSFDVHMIDVYSRILSDSSSAAYSKSSSDLYAGNYEKIDRYSTNLALKCSIRTSATDKGYGKIPNTNLYYDTPDDNNTYYPLLKAGWWNGISYWLKDDYCTSSIAESKKKSTGSNEFIPLTSAILAIASKIDSSITAVQSQFLTDQYNPVTGDEQGLIYITQKSNILNHSYDMAAWKAPVQFSQIAEFLRNALNCYYDIVENGANKTLRVEHVLFYLNGGSYIADSRTVLNLSLYKQNPGQKLLSFCSNNWSYDTEDIYTRYEFSWMDTQSALFNGDAIVVPEKYTLSASDSTDDRAVEYFSTDIAFLYAVPSECSSDGFCAIKLNYGESILHTVSCNVSGKTYAVQNYYLSFHYLQPKFLLYNIPAPYVLLNGDNDVASNYVATPEGYAARLRENEVTFQIPNGVSLTPAIIIRTEVGVGTIETLSIDLSSDTATATLRYALDN